jgi:hypothetical protein
MKLLRTSGPWHPGGYSYIDPRTGKKYDGSSADFDMRSKEIQNDRKLNPDIYPPAENGGKWLDLEFIRGQLSNYICGQLSKRGLASRYCTDDSGALIGTKPLKSAVINNPVQVRKCRKCGGTDLEPEHCKTCGGNKIRAYICKTCNTRNNK